jgi:hypothetical protein
VAAGGEPGREALDDAPGSLRSVEEDDREGDNPILFSVVRPLHRWHLLLLCTAAGVLVCHLGRGPGFGGMKSPWTGVLQYRGLRCKGEIGNFTFQVLFIYGTYSPLESQPHGSIPEQFPLGHQCSTLVLISSLPIRYWHSFVDWPCHSEERIFDYLTLLISVVSKVHINEYIEDTPNGGRDLNACIVKHLYDNL